MWSFCLFLLPPLYVLRHYLAWLLVQLRTRAAVRFYTTHYLPCSALFYHSSLLFYLRLLPRCTYLPCAVTDLLVTHIVLWVFNTLQHNTTLYVQYCHTVVLVPYLPAVRSVGVGGLLVICQIYRVLCYATTCSAFLVLLISWRCHCY